jgi:hypothetical protein
MRISSLISLCISGVCGLVACRDTPRSDAGGTRTEGPPTAEPAAPRRGAGVPAAGSEASGRETVPIEIVAVVAGRKAAVRGVGECNHTEEASIYEVPATLWRVGYQAAEGAEIQDLNLTLWQPKTGGDQFTIALQLGGETHQIATVKGGALAGSGSATVRPDGTGGTFVVQGKDEKGVALQLTVTCDRFTEPVAEGG